MSEILDKPCTAFDGHRRLAAGPLRDLALSVKRATEPGSSSPVSIYDDATGTVIDIDCRGIEQEFLARLAGCGVESLVQTTSQALSEPRARGRPKLGVIAREVTLLPRHWDWLNAQPGGASVALRKLVEEARRANSGRDRLRGRQEAAYRFMSARAGDLPGFEEAARALFADDRGRFDQCVSAWPGDLRNYATKLAFTEGTTDVEAAT
ncbi:DUF2239 family protein [Hydrocarboniphaga sp.]|uniref:DUF2239 family protein n=1 Tax=Hydrocarboniphaga sp. TaxID=2033016 RepID=UPI0026266C9E|nr:DUF2239 family protein [Hydrocarboniphaga sp.]